MMSGIIILKLQDIPHRLFIKKMHGPAHGEHLVDRYRRDEIKGSAHRPGLPLLIYGPVPHPLVVEESLKGMEYALRHSGRARGI